MVKDIHNDVLGQSEKALQQKTVFYFNNSFPNLRGLYCYNNNDSDGGWRGKINKFLGIVKGRSDMVFYYNSKAFHIELKTATGQQRQVQKDWQKLVESQGFTYVLIRSLAEFKVYINKILKEN